jgi:hypothetical protein
MATKKGHLYGAVVGKVKREQLAKADPPRRRSRASDAELGRQLEREEREERREARAYEEVRVGLGGSPRAFPGPHEAARREVLAGYPGGLTAYDEAHDAGLRNAREQDAALARVLARRAEREGYRWEAHPHADPHHHVGPCDVACRQGRRTHPHKPGLATRRLGTGGR